MSKTLFVTGGAGYVGSHCCKAFAQAGWRVIVYDNLSRGWRDFVQWGPLIEGDLLDAEHLTAAMRSCKPDAVAHFAALAYVGESVSDPALYYRTNTVGALNVLDAMRASDVPVLVFSSTCATYGIPPDTAPIDEKTPQSPINPYGWSKLFVEKMLTDYGQAYGVRSVALRYFNAAGADLDGDVGERHDPETHVIPLALRGATRGDYEFQVFGADFPTPDGSAVRDYIHVTDLGNAHRLALEYLFNNGASDVFNLGTGEGVSVLEIAAAVERVVGKEVRKAIVGRRAGDPPALVASPLKARQVLGWSAQHSSIDTILQSAWRWHQKDGHG